MGVLPFTTHYILFLFSKFYMKKFIKISTAILLIGAMITGGIMFYRQDEIAGATGANRTYIQATNRYGQTIYYNYDTNDISGISILNKAGTTNGTLVNSPTTGSSGKLKEVITFNGTDQYINSGVKASTSGTIITWFNVGTMGVDALIIGQKGVTNGRSYVSYNPTFKISGGVGDQNYLTIYGTTTVTAGVWYHVAITWNGSNVYLYCNGAQEYTGAQVGAVETNNNFFFGGMNNNGVMNNSINGTLDESKIYNRALSASEVLQDYNSTKRTYIQAQNQTGLVGQWGFGTADYNQTTDVLYGRYGSDKLTAVSDTALATGFDGRANQALTFDGSADYLTQYVHDTQQGTLTASMVATNAFINDSGQDFAPYVKATDTLGDELVTNGDFTAWTGDNPDWWILATTETAGSYVTESSGKARIVSDGSAMGIVRRDLLTIGKTYKITYSIKSVTAGSLKICDETGAYFYVASDNIVGDNKVAYFVARATNIAILRQSGTTDITIDDISIKEAPPIDLKYMIVATDSTGKKAWGYIGEQGTGETLGTYIVNDDCSADNVANWSVSTDAGDAVVFDTDHYVQSTTDGSVYLYKANNLTLTVGALYKVGKTVKRDTACNFHNTYLGTDYYSIILQNTVPTTSYVDYSAYATALTGWDSLGLRVSHGTVPATVSLKNIYMQLVTTPTANGVKIYSTKTGSTQSWANVETGFNANAISSYEIRKTDFQITGEMTIGLWFNHADTVNSYIIAKSDFTAAGSWSLLTQSSGSVVFTYGTSSKSSGVVFNETNIWYHIVVTVDSSGQVRFYKNGNLVATPSGTITIPDTYQPLTVAVKYGGTTYFKGVIDEPVIYNRALPATEILNLYNLRKTFIQ